MAGVRVGAQEGEAAAVRIEIHDDDGHVYGYERRADNPFKWLFSVDGAPMPRMSENADGRDVLWQMAIYVLEGVHT